MEYRDPQDPKANEPGDHPPMGERKGNWKVLLVAWGLGAVGVFSVALYFGVF